MQLGMVGLGRMGSNLVRRAMQGGHECVVHDINPQAVAALADIGAVAPGDLAGVVEQLAAPRVVWIMLPAALVEETVGALAALMSPGDIIIDGGNSFYQDDIRRFAALESSGIHYVDIGTSGGVFGLERGFCLMVGGETESVSHLGPLLTALAPGVDATSRTPSRSGDPDPAELGWLHCGPAGAGHFVKMVHNGIEYGLMAALAEGLAVLQGADAGTQPRSADAESAPLAHPEFYAYDFDIASITEVWRRGSVVSSWLLDLTAEALHQEPDLTSFQGRVSDSGEGRWTVHAAVEEGVPAHVLTAALYSRFSSRGNADFAGRVLSAMRQQFGGHREQHVNEGGS
ncbi:MAG: phosphogluconate dehydrogenase (NAD(+)-dependent, decarboxylating) [Candidatus Nanopelagicales bacterium]